MNKKIKKVYFCGSIRGDVSKRNLYPKILSILQSLNLEVLSAHVCSPKVLDLEENIPFEKIAERDLRLIKKADIAIAEVSAPSLGVGYELAQIENRKIPLLAIRHKDIPPQKISALINGIFKPVSYGEENLHEIIQNWINKLN